MVKDSGRDHKYTDSNGILRVPSKIRVEKASLNVNREIKRDQPAMAKNAIVPTAKPSKPAREKVSNKARIPNA